MMDGSSGTGSNANSSAGPFTSEESASQSHRQKTDIAWAHVSEGINAQGRKTMTCIYCHKTIAGGGINQMKQHLTGAKGNIVACGRVPPEVRHAILGSLKDFSDKKKEKRGDFGIENPFGRSTYEFGGDEVIEIPHPHTKGVTINEAGAPSDKGKRKATTTAFQYDPTFSTHPEITNGLFDYIESKVDWCTLDVLSYEIGMFQDRQGSFGRKSAILSSKKNRPESWWKLFGCDAQNLQKLAIRILSQTASSSGCERNWSVFERIHTKKRNRLEHQRLNDLVYVHYNLRLQYRNEQPKRCYDPVDYESIDKTDFWVVEEEPRGELDYDELEEELEELPVAPESSNFQQLEDNGDEAEHGDVNLDLFQRRGVLVDEDDDWTGM